MKCPRSHIILIYLPTVEGIGRVFYCTQVGRSIVVLHSFVKKTQEIPDAELRLARKRLKDVQHG
ncbi:MAG: type II toxin-antitoxin system RelE/ParE family toxin [Rhodoferax sp.]|nr:type II toxin-antitoxin system RelE/ParE family toxin [Rhodoferax sp.]